MGPLVMSFVTALAVVASASGEANETCVLNETCTLQIPAEGTVKEFFCVIGRDPVPVAFYPTNLQWHQQKDFMDRTSVFLEQPGRGVVLQIRRVQEIHQGRYKCEVEFSSGNTKHFINLTVRNSPNPQQTPAPNSTTTRPRPPALDKSHLQHLWILLILVIVALAVVLLYVCCRKILNEILRQTVQTQYHYCSVPLDPPGDSSTQQNGLNEASLRANGLPNGECQTLF